jgi:hypothetical protein
MLSQVDLVAVADAVRISSHRSFPVAETSYVNMVNGMITPWQNNYLDCRSSECCPSLLDWAGLKLEVNWHDRHQSSLAKRQAGLVLPMPLVSLWDPQGLSEISGQQASAHAPLVCKSSLLSMRHLCYSPWKSSNCIGNRCN